MPQITIPDRLGSLLEQDPKVRGIVDLSIGRFSEWIEHSGTPFFREYTDHGPRHISEVLETSTQLVSLQSWEVLSPKDAAVLILASLLHDVALHLQEDGLLNLVQSDRRGRRIAELDRDDWGRLWEDFASGVAHFDEKKLMSLFGKPDPVHIPDLGRPESWTAEQYALIGEFFRCHHARLAHEVAVFGVPGPSGPPLTLVEDDLQLLDISGLVARSHGMGLRACLDYLGEKYHPRDFGGIHAVFLMVLLRVADYLQIQPSRASEGKLKVRRLRSPVSRREWRVHHAIRNITYNDPDPEAVCIQVDHAHTDLSTFLRIREWVLGIQSELDTSWAVLGEVYGRYSENGLNRLGLTVRRVRSDTDDVEVFASQVPYVPEHVTFRSAHAEMLKLLIGPLYGERPEIGVRELIQNSVDAVLELEEFCKQNRVKSDQIPRPSHDADVQVAVVLDGDDARLVVSDAGIGMTVGTVIDYFLCAGASYRKSDFWREQFVDEDGRATIARSGRFGVGALAAFLLGDSITVTTRHVTDAEFGIRFEASLDSEAIVLERCERPIGTTVSIRLSSKAHEKLLGSRHYFDDTCWDWYCLSSPRVSRIICGEPGEDSPGAFFRRRASRATSRVSVDGSSVPLVKVLKQRHALSRARSRLPLAWHRISVRDFHDIQWTYDPSPGLVCNGIRVLDGWGDWRFQDFPAGWGRTGMRCPNLSVFDPDGRLPLTLTRDRLATGELSFLKYLLRSVLRDFLGYCLVYAPGEPIWGGRRTGQDRILYPGCTTHWFGDTRFSPASWFQTSDGTGLLDSHNLSAVGVDRVLCHDLSQSGRETRWLESVAHLPQCSLRCAGKRNAIRDAFYEWNCIRTSGFDKSTICMGSRFLIPSKTADHWFQKGKLLVGFRNRVAIEWRNCDWVIWRLGTCPDSDLLQRIAREAPVSRSDAEITAVEKYLRGGRVSPNSVLGEAWQEIIGVPVIPFNGEERREKLADAFHRLRKYVAAWEKRHAEGRKRSESGDEG